MTLAHHTTAPETGRAGQAPHLHETGMLAMPTMDPPASEQIVETVRDNSEAWKEATPHG